MLPAPTAITPDPPSDAKNLKITRTAKLSDAAAIALQMRSIMILTLYTTSRPWRSDIGAAIQGPKTKPVVYSVMGSKPMFRLVILNSCMIPGRPATSVEIPVVLGRC
jgi:hypothetical protein